MFPTGRTLITKIKVTRTYQRLRHKAAFLKPTNTSTYRQPTLVLPVSTAIHGIEKVIQLCYSTVRGLSLFTGSVRSNS